MYRNHRHADSVANAPDACYARTIVFSFDCATGQKDWFCVATEVICLDNSKVTAYAAPKYLTCSAKGTKYSVSILKCWSCLYTHVVHVHNMLYKFLLVVPLHILLYLCS